MADDSSRKTEERFLADPENRSIYEQEAAKKALWLQLVEARLAAGLTQEQFAQRLGVSSLKSRGSTNAATMPKA